MKPTWRRSRPPIRFLDQDRLDRLQGISNAIANSVDAHNWSIDYENDGVSITVFLDEEGARLYGEDAARCTVTQHGWTVQLPPFATDNERERANALGAQMHAAFLLLA